MTGWKAARLEQVPLIEPEQPHEPDWRPLQHTFGLTAFGANAYSGGPGTVLVADHDESESGQEELYLVVAGAAEFTLDGETLAAPAVTVVAAAPSVRRTAVAVEPGTLLLAFGGPQRQRFESSWSPRHFDRVPGL